MVRKLTTFLIKKYAFYLKILMVVVLFIWLSSFSFKYNSMMKMQSSSQTNLKVSSIECKYAKPKLIGKMNIDNSISEQFKNLVFNLSYNQKYDKHTKLDFVNKLRHGGSYQPKLNCNAKTLAFVIPYKNRLNNLYTFLYNMHPYLQRQQLKYTIFLVEQINDGLFNKGILNNAAFNEILYEKNSFFKSNSDYFRNYDCVMYHDVDLLPTDDLNLYACPDDKPVHYSIFVDNIDYNKVWPILIGGAIIFSKEHYIKANGYSNRFWGWGGEDDDMYVRLVHSNINFTRPAKSTQYKMLRHRPGPRNMRRFKLLNESIDAYKKEGLNNVKYNLKNVITYPLFTHLLIDIGKEPPN